MGKIDFKSGNYRKVVGGSPTLRNRPRFVDGVFPSSFYDHIINLAIVGGVPRWASGVALAILMIL
eukprot:4076967-Karenia_brevis.AAC.1